MEGTFLSQEKSLNFVSQPDRVLDNRGFTFFRWRLHVSREGLQSKISGFFLPRSGWTIGESFEGVGQAFYT